MKKYFFVLMIAYVCAGAMNQGIAETSEKSDYSLGSEYKGNFVWSGAMNLCWNELAENILHGKLMLKSNDAPALKMAERFNHATFSKEDLDEKSYYIKSGFGRGTLDLINREVKEKFPDKSFADLDFPLAEKDLISYAYFLKAVEYLTQFTEGFAQFQGQQVKGFYADGPHQKGNIRILKYWSNDQFIIALRLKDEKDEIFLVKGFVEADPKQVVDEINQYNESRLRIGRDDVFSMPKLHLDYRRDYTELIDQILANPGFEGYFISEMFENIKFDMDHKGARVESQAVIAVERAAMMSRDNKQFILDQPFWVVMKRQDRPNPYFILHVQNTELMEKQI
jgi:hypothetical protein